MNWQQPEQIERALESTFNDILNSRMSDMPLLNPALSVQALGFERFGDDWTGVLITPWFMNLLLLPMMNSDWCALPHGHQFERSFPYGVFSFTVADEMQLGRYAQCSLFSPMFQFQDQSAARMAAQSALNTLLTPPAPPSLSRRKLLRLHIRQQ